MPASSMPTQSVSLTVVAAAISVCPAHRRENLQFYVLEEVQAPVFQTVGNLKVLGAAGFSALLLGSRFRAHQYLAMGLLIGGSMALRCSVMWIGPARMLATGTLILCSGFNLVIYERLLKAPKLSVHAANATFYAASVLMHGTLAETAGGGLRAHLAAFSIVEWGTVGGQVANGVCNSVLVVQVGAIGKQFISQGAVITLTLFGALSRRDPFVVTLPFVLGSALVFSGVWTWKFGAPQCLPFGLGRAFATGPHPHDDVTKEAHRQAEVRAHATRQRKEAYPVLSKAGKHD